MKADEKQEALPAKREPHKSWKQQPVTRGDAQHTWVQVGHGLCLLGVEFKSRLGKWLTGTLHENAIGNCSCIYSDVL